MIDPDLDKWWHSPQMVGVLWSVIVALLGFIRHLYHRLGEHGKSITRLNQWKDDLGNGITLKEVKVKIDALWEKHNHN